MDDVFRSGPAAQPVFQGFHALPADHQLADDNPAHFFVPGRKAVLFPYDDFLAHVHETSGQITRVRGPQRCVCQGFPAAVAAQEELQHRQAFTEVCAHGQLNALSGW